MLVLLFEAGGSRQALPTRDVVEVVPWVALRPVAGSPEWVAGYFSYRGTVTPVLDVGRLSGTEPCVCRWNSRLILVVLPGSEGRRVGLLAERVTTADVPAPSASGATIEGAWGPLLLDEQGLFQLIELPRLLSAERVHRLQSRAVVES